MVPVFEAVGGEFHEGLLKRGPLRGQLVQRDPGPRGQLGDPRRGHPRDGQRAVRSGLGPGALPGDHTGQPGRVRRPDQDTLPGIAAGELRDRAVGEQPPAAYDDQVVGGYRHLVHQVAGDQYRPALGREHLHQCPDPQHALGIQPVDRLVKQQRPRVAEQRGGDAEALPHAEREPADPPAGHAAKPGQRDDLVHPRGRQAMRLRQAAQVVARAAAGMDGLCLEQRADGAQRDPEVTVGQAADPRLPAVGPVEPEQQPHGGGLPRAVRPEKAGNLPRLHGKRQIVDGQPRTVPLAEMTRLDHDSPQSGPEIAMSLTHPAGTGPGSAAFLFENPIRVLSFAWRYVLV